MTRILIFIFCCLACNTNVSVNQSDNYPDEIKNNHLEDMFDTTKWLLYCVNISDRNDTGYLLDDTLNTVKLYDCEMRHSYLDIEEDTVVIATRFFYNDTLVQVPVKKDFTRFVSVKFIGGEPESFSINSFHLPYDLVMRDDREEHFLSYIKDKKVGNAWLKKQVKIRSKARINSSE